MSAAVAPVRVLWQNLQVVWSNAHTIPSAHSKTYAEQRRRAREQENKRLAGRRVLVEAGAGRGEWRFTLDVTSSRDMLASITCHMPASSERSFSNTFLTCLHKCTHQDHAYFRTTRDSSLRAHVCLSVCSEKRCTLPHEFMLGRDSNWAMRRATYTNRKQKMHSARILWH
jgi:hypothetical protein